MLTVFIAFIGMVIFFATKPLITFMLSGQFESATIARESYRSILFEDGLIESS